MYRYNDVLELSVLELARFNCILNVKISTSNVGIYGELCRYQLYITRFIILIRYWCNIVNTNNSILSTVYTMAFDDHVEGPTNWVSDVKSLLCEN